MRHARQATRIRNALEASTALCYLLGTSQMKEPPKFPEDGLCSNLAGVALAHGAGGGLYYNFISDVLKNWPHFTGNRSYPVPGGGSEPPHWMANTYFHDAQFTPYMWKRGEYAERRRDMCLHIANELADRYDIDLEALFADDSVFSEYGCYKGD